MVKNVVAVCVCALSLSACTGERLTVERLALVSASNLGGAGLQVELTPESRRDFARFTAAHLGRVVEVSAAGRVLARPTIRSPMEGGTLLLGGELPAQELSRIADELRAKEAVITVRAVDVP